MGSPLLFLNQNSTLFKGSLSLLEEFTQMGVKPYRASPIEFHMGPGAVVSNLILIQILYH